jgi:lipid-binding SYLF domain-containing protein
MREQIARKALSCFFTTIVMMLLIFPGFAADKQKDEDTLRQANLVLQGLIDSKSIPPDLLSKADCVLVLPNVKKFGFGVGGSGGRGPLLCRGGEDFKEMVHPCDVFRRRRWCWLQVGGSSTDFVLLLMNAKVVNQF